jgi:hypothetical protein
MTLLIKNNSVVAIVPFAEVMGFVAVAVLLPSGKAKPLL